MKSLLYPSRETWKSLCQRPVLDSEDLDSVISGILEKVKNEGDSAIFRYSENYDGVFLKTLKVPVDDITSAFKDVPGNLQKAISVAKENIEKFHKPQLISENIIETTRGVTCWRKSIPIEKIGLYIPGGSAPLFSTVLMLALPAKIAGCKDIIICTPPDKKGNVNPLILYSASLAGVKDIFTIGGAQAIAAMAYGTESVPKVDKIFGPGNQYVTRAKEMVQLEGIPIDMPAGPSEVLVIADKNADPGFVASDLLSQAEHGPDSHAVMVTDSDEIMDKVYREVKIQIKSLKRRKIAERSLENSLLILFSSLSECLEFSNLYAPEHLIISTSDPGSLAEKVLNAGSVFIGKYSCESAGDYASGTNHTLPTNGFAASFSGVAVESFMKKITFQEITAEGLRNLGPVIEQMAEAEHLQGHKNSVTLRLKSLGNA